MKYDPILCMMVDDSVKTKDAMFNVVYKTDSGTMQALLKAENEKEAENKVRAREGNKFKSLIGVRKMTDSIIDNAIRNCDIKTLNWAVEYSEFSKLLNKGAYNNEEDFEKYLEKKYGKHGKDWIFTSQFERAWNN